MLVMIEFTYNQQVTSDNFGFAARAPRSKKNSID